MAKKPVRKTLPGYIQRRMNMDGLLASRRVLQILDEQGAMTQAEASGLLGVTLGACSLHFQRLKYEGLIRSQLVASRQRGRPLSRWEVDREHNCTMGMVFNPPHLHLQIDDFGGLTILTREANLTPCRSSDQVAGCVLKLVQEAMGLVKARGAVLRQASCALPGVIDAASGRVRRAVNFPAMEGLNIPLLFREKVNLPVHVNSLGVAYYYGEAGSIPQDCTAMVFYWDLGLGFIFGRNGHLLAVQGGDERGLLLSELGHVKVTDHGPRCHCGQAGCLEAYAGGAMLLSKVAHRGVRSLEAMARVGETGDPGVVRPLREAVRFLGRHLAWPLQMLGVGELRVTGPLAPVFDAMKAQFVEGLGEVLGPHRAAHLNIAVNRDYQRSLLKGANLTAHRAFLHPEEFERLSCVSSTLQGRLLAGLPA
jgi:predicted NBD/HSP70 family sugar kinase